MSGTDVARRLRLQQPLGEDDRWLIEQAVRDAQADLEAYLGLPVTPRLHTDHHAMPDVRGWQLRYSPLVEIVSVEPEEYPDGGGKTGRYTVTYRAGLDGASAPELGPLRRYVTAHAMHSPDVQRLLARLKPEESRTVTSVSVEGQSIGFEPSFPRPGQAGSGAPGALPTLESCERWKRRGVYQKDTREYPPGLWRRW